jgi:FKBP-type peptidyl-prolyl cis-trans isomerase FklB
MQIKELTGISGNVCCCLWPIAVACICAFSGHDGTIMDMKKSLVALIFGLTVAIGFAIAQSSGGSKLPEAPAPKAQNPPPAASSQPSSSFKDQKEKVSYALGMNLGANFKRESVDIDPNILVQGLKDSMAGGKTLMTEEESRATLIQLQNDMRAKQEQQMQQQADANKKEGEAFLAANKTKEGVVTTPSGLQYKVLSQGTGAKPTASDTVVCNYKGTLINGKEFDSSYKRGQPAEFPVSGVIKGWTEALQLMPVGSKYQLFIPPDLAYGMRGAGPDIGPNSTLIFEVELISIKSKENPATGKEAAPPPK